MTRFARATGSKASNTRTPEEATSWLEMKQQMEASKFRGHSKNGVSKPNTPVSNSNFKRVKPIVKHNERVWENFDDQIVMPHSSNIGISNGKQMEASKFRGHSENGVSKLDNTLVSNWNFKRVKPIVKHNERVWENFDDQIVLPHSSNIGISNGKQMEASNLRGRSENSVSKPNNTLVPNWNLKQVKLIVNHNEKVGENFDDQIVLPHSSNIGISNDKPEEKRSTSVTEKSDIIETSYNTSKKTDNTKTFCNTSWAVESQDINKSWNELDTINDNEIHMKKKMKKDKKEYDATSKDTPIYTDSVNMETDVVRKREEGFVDQKRKRNYESPLNFKADLNNKNTKFNRFDNHSNYSTFDKPSHGSTNSKIDIACFQGYEVKQEDADRLYKLRKDLRAQGIPRKTVLSTLHSERRKAEKKLSREKKMVCFKCRQFGHSLSDCPELEDQSDICFKCGSTEHTSKSCRAVQSDSFKHTHCFICQEQGHIARQCPDNPRGLYPKGGSCKICGDVTHLRSDCPDLVQEKEKNKFTLGTLNDQSIEGLEEEFIDAKTSPVKKFGVIKF